VFQDRFYKLLQKRRDANRAEAENERASIAAGIVDGKLTLWTALQILAGFIVLMFFFLLIAIERHQRRLAGSGTVNGAMITAQEA
jgi:type VI protein secretion system component VasF